MQKETTKDEGLTSSPNDSNAPVGGSLSSECFFIDENFYTDLGDLMTGYEIDEDKVEELPDDWAVNVEEASLEKIFTLKEDFVIDAIMDSTDPWEERFPEESDSTFEKIRNAVKQSIDIKKMNDLLPSLYYPNGKKSVITKADLVEWCK